MCVHCECARASLEDCELLVYEWMCGCGGVTVDGDENYCVNFERLGRN